MSAYTIDLTQADWDTIAFVGHRYAWSDALEQHGPTHDDDGAVKPVELTEYEAWELGAAFDNDTLGGHGAFPMLDSQTELSRKLHAFWDSLV